jgi:ABC-type thiamin/hydroxymethylpyrimidine transport system permease subunit
MKKNTFRSMVLLYGMVLGVLIEVVFISFTQTTLLDRMAGALISALPSFCTLHYHKGCHKNKLLFLA